MALSPLFGKDGFELVPVAFQGRFLPADSYAKQWFYHLTDKPTSPTANALDLLWQLHFDRRSSVDDLERALQTSYQQLVNQKLSFKEIALQLEQQHPFHSRLANAGMHLKVLPSKAKSGEWYALHALHVKVFNSSLGKLELAKNFTFYPDFLFEKIREAYFQFEEATLKNDSVDISPFKAQLAALLMEGYKALAKRPYRTALGKNLHYPSLMQIHAEAFYVRYPLTLVCITMYTLALGLFTLMLMFNRPPLFAAGFFLLLIAFGLHTCILLLRCYILGRPPVANMLETVLYVPWVAVLISLILRLFYVTPFPLIASASASLVLLILLQLNFYASSFENVQAVLDSHYWLFIHVLMVVGSYGLFLLSSFLGHIYLIGMAYYKRETPALMLVVKSLLQVVYAGVALLVAGTLLGGIWAAQSWGRFWDWDPKESWAFVSICIYLLWIHAYRFGKIQHFGLSVGAILGFLAISFTWYGVNYILGTGLHSYGFGTGGSYYYYSYIFAELLFLTAVIQSYYLSKDIDKNTPTC